MFRPTQIRQLAVAALMSLALAACASQKDPAQQALTELDASLAKVSEIAGKYVPESYAEVQAQIAALQASFDKGEFGTVVTGAPKAAAAVRKLQADAIIAKAELAKEMNAEWVEMAKTMPDTIVAIDKKISRQGSRPPKGLDAGAYKQLVADFDEAKKTWTAAGELGNAGKYEDAVMEGRKVQAVVDATKLALGMQAG